MSDRVAAFEESRRDLVLLAYRMLGDMGRAEDAVQDAWLRWSRTEEVVESPRAYLITIVTRLCLNELDSARARKEESRSDRLPEPVATRSSAEELEALDQISMALMYTLQRLTPAERAVLLLHDIFDFDHAAIGGLVGKTEPACRKLLERARKSLAEERRTLTATPDEHRRLLAAFLQASTAGDVEQLVALLADDAIMVTDGGPEGVRDAAGQRNLPGPLVGAARIANFVITARRRNGGNLDMELRLLNDRPAAVFFRNGHPFAALLLAVSNDKITRVFFHADPMRLTHLA
jgi:RNA polymerase sigma-70 factor (ECF subfamily)